MHTNSDSVTIMRIIYQVYALFPQYKGFTVYFLKEKRRLFIYGIAPLFTRIKIPFIKNTGKNIGYLFELFLE